MVYFIIKNHSFPLHLHCYYDFFRYDFSLGHFHRKVYTSKKLRRINRNVYMTAF